MVKVKITTQKPRTKYNKSNETYVLISIYMNLPVIKADPRIGVYISDNPEKFICSQKLTFEEMGKLMATHKCKTWKELSTCIEKIYSKKQIS